MTKPNKKLLSLYTEMNKIALQEVERLARKCLTQNPKKLNEFVMCMGTFFFTDKTGDVLYNFAVEKLSGYKVLDDFVCEWNGELKLTGNPMRFTADGEKITDW